MVLFDREISEVLRQATIYANFKDYCTNNRGTFERTVYSMECHIPNKGHILMKKDEKGNIDSVWIKDAKGNTILDLDVTGRIDCAYTEDFWYVCIVKTFTGRASIHMSPWFEEIVVRVRYPRLKLTTTHKITPNQ